jgi:hypothetical protein
MWAESIGPLTQHHDPQVVYSAEQIRDSYKIKHCANKSLANCRTKKTKSS